MSPISTPRLPRLERVLLDTDVNPEVEVILQAVGFDVESSHRIDVDVQDDVAIIKWARRRRRIVITHDKYGDRRTKDRANKEIGENGGRVISVRGGSDQDPYSTSGKVLAFRSQWHGRFVTLGQHGIAFIGEQNLKFWDQEEVLVRRPRPLALDVNMVLEASARLREYQAPPERNRRKNPRRRASEELL